LYDVKAGNFFVFQHSSEKQKTQKSQSREADVCLCPLNRLTGFFPGNKINFNINEPAHYCDKTNIRGYIVFQTNFFARNHLSITYNFIYINILNMM